MVKFRNAVFAVITALAISMSALVIGAPAAQAASKSPAKPTCSQAFLKLPSWTPDPFGLRASCEARVLWERIDSEAAKIEKVKSQDQRAKILAKYYWAIATPLTKDALNRSSHYYWAPAFRWARGGAEEASYDRKQSRNFLISLRDFVARSSSNYTQMNSGVLMLQAIDKLELGQSLGGTVTKEMKALQKAVKEGLQFSDLDTPMSVLAKAAIPVVKDGYLDKARNELLLKVLLPYYNS